MAEDNFITTCLYVMFILSLFQFFRWGILSLLYSYYIKILLLLSVVVRDGGGPVIVIMLM